MLLYIYLKKVYARVDRKALWEVYRIYGVRVHLLEGVMVFFEKVQ